MQTVPRTELTGGRFRSIAPVDHSCGITIAAMDITTKKTVTALSRSVTRPVPADWGRSELTRFIDLAEQQAYASFASLPQWIRVLELIDQNLTVGAPTYFHEIDEPRAIAAKLFIRSFGTFRAACRLGISGQSFETTVLVRSILESATYAWVCGHSQPHREAWDKRGDGQAERTAARVLFRWGTLKAMLQQVNGDLADRVQDLYEQTIEYGAHPNVDGVTLSSEMRQVASDRYEMSTIFLHGEDAVLLAILDLCRAMELVYRLLELTIGDRLRILNIDQRVDEERRLVVGLIDELEREKSRV
jgi:hypothetical protein